MSDAALYYRHSGQFSPASVIITLLVGLATAIVVAPIYAIIVFYMPIVYVNVLGTFGLAALLGIVIRKTAMAKQIRNVPIVMLIALIVGLVAEYAAFVGWLGPVFGWSALIINPSELYAELDYVVEQGVWSLKGDTVKGPFLVIVWVVEGLLIVGGTIYFAREELSTTPFCENCLCWLPDKTLVGPFEPIAKAAALKDSLERGDFAALGEIKALGSEAPNDHFAEYELISCPTCDQMAVVSIRNVTLVVDKEGKLTRTAKDVVNKLLIDRASCDLIKELGPGPENATEEAAALESLAADVTPADEEVDALDALSDATDEKDADNRA